IDEMAKNEGLLKRWLKNWYASTHGYTFQMTSIAKRCAPESEISAFVPTMFRNLSDELADEFSKTPHHHLRHRILERAGTRYELERAPVDPERETEAFQLQGYRTGVSCIPDPMYALGNVYGIEANWVLETPKLSAQLRSIGFDAKDTESTDL